MDLEASDLAVLANLDRGDGQVPAGCAWLDDRTVADLELVQVFRAVDRTTTPLGSQALWRWLVAPACETAVVAERERRIAPLAADPALRERVRRTLEPTTAIVHAQLVPRMLWGPTAARFGVGRYAALVGTMVMLLAGGFWVPWLWAGAVAVFSINILIDDWANVRLAHHARALEVLGGVLGAATRMAAWLPPTLAGSISADLAKVKALRDRVGILTVNDPLEIASVLRAGFLVRLFVLASCLGLIETQRERLRRIVLWVGEIDALRSIAELRRERTDVELPVLYEQATAHVEARDLKHPAVAGAIGNDVRLEAGSLLVTGSNMSGKSTFLRTLAVNAICAQSIHTTFGRWRASILRACAVMRTADDPARGMSTFAVEVEAIGDLIACAGDDTLPCLFLVDEPFTGTNPAVRVSIATAVLDYLAAHDIVIAATHDLDVAARVSDRFRRCHFLEIDEIEGTFDRTLRDGVAPSTNAIAVLRRAGYPREIVDAVTSDIQGARAVPRSH